MSWMINCREATHLSLQAEDQPLRMPDRLKLRFHLVICAACPKFTRQLKLMRESMDPWRAYRDGSDAPAEPNERTDPPR